MQVFKAISDPRWTILGVDTLLLSLQNKIAENEDITASSHDRSFEAPREWSVLKSKDD